MIYRDLLAHMRKLVACFQSSVKAKERLKEIGKEMEPRGDGRTAYLGEVTLGLDTPTRWNSTLDMLINLDRMKHPLDKLRVVAQQDKMAVPSQENFLSEDEWAMIVALIEVLAPFKGATLNLLNEQFPSLGITFVILKKLVHHCASAGREASHSAILDLVIRLQAETTVRLNTLAEHNQHLAQLSMVVNPGLKLKYVKDVAEKTSIRQSLLHHIVTYYPDRSAPQSSPS